MAFVFFCWKIIPESPRWLVSKGKANQATEILTEIAKVNKTDPPEDLGEQVNKLANETAETAYGYLSLFRYDMHTYIGITNLKLGSVGYKVCYNSFYSSWNLATRTIYVTIAFTASAFVYYQLVINIGNMAGNMFLNLFLMGLVEGPGCFMGVYLCDKTGRRWTHSILLLINAALFFALMWVVYYPNLKWLVIVFCMWVKMNISATFVIAYVQAMEIFPTSVRQSGIGFATLISQMISIGGPYVIFLGAVDLKLPYAIMFMVCLIGSIATMCMPETLGRNLPESLEDAKTFGKEDKFFSYLPNRYVNLQYE